MLCGLTPEGLADFNKLVGFQHAIRPFEMERVTLATPNDPLMAGLTTRDVVMESGQQVNRVGRRQVHGQRRLQLRRRSAATSPPSARSPGRSISITPAPGPAGTIGRGTWSTASRRPIAGSTVLRSPTAKASRSSGPWNCRRRKRSSNSRSCPHRSSTASAGSSSRSTAATRSRWNWPRRRAGRTCPCRRTRPGD